MPQVNLPITLGTAHWDKQKQALAKAPKAPPTKLAEELKALTRLHLAVDWKAFDSPKADSADAVADAQRGLEDAVKGPIKALAEQAKAVLDAATKFEAEAGKDKQFPKEVLAAAAAIIKAAKEYRADIDLVVAELRKSLATQLQAAQKSKPAAAAAAEGDPKSVKLVRSRALDAIRKIRKPAPGAKPMHFLVVQGKQTVATYLGPSVGPAQDKLLRGLIPTEAPFKTIKDAAGYLVWEKNAVTFVSDVLPGGLVKKQQAWLKKILKLNLKLRVRRTDGSVEESEGEPLADDMLKPDAEELAAQHAAAAEFEQRLAALTPQIRKAMAGPAGADLKELLANITQHREAGEMLDAVGALDDIELLLADPATTAPAAPPQPSVTYEAMRAALQPWVKKAADEGSPDASKHQRLMAFAADKAEAKDFLGAVAALKQVEQLLDHPSARTEAPAASDAGAAFRARLAAMLAELKEARAAGLPGALDASARATEAGMAASKHDYDRGNALLDEAQALLRHAQAGTAATPSGAAGDQRPLAPLWESVSDSVIDQLTALVIKMRGFADPELDRMADDLLNVANEYLAECSDVLEELDDATSEERAEIADEALEFIRRHQSRIASDPLMEAADVNPLGVKINLRKAMDGGLKEIAQALGG